MSNVYFTAAWIVAIITPIGAGIIWFTIGPAPEINDATVMEFIDNINPTQIDLEIEFRARYDIDRRLVLVDALENIIDDNLIEFTMMGGYEVYTVVEESE